MPVDLLDAMLTELEYRGCAYWDLYPKFYIASIGGHLFNVHSMVKQILYVSGLPYDTRLHIFLVAFPGFGKSFWLFQFLLSDVGLIGSTRIPTTFEGYVTEAGWVGTKRFGAKEAGNSTNGDNDGTFTQYGIAQRYATGIVGCEEFAAIASAMTQSYNRQFDTALLTSLDSGFVNKTLAAGPIKYRTSVTLWTGTQPARFDLAGGLGRRLTFMHHIPTDEDVEILRQARRKGFGRQFEQYRTSTIKQNINKRKDEVGAIRNVIMHPGVYKYLDKFKMMPYEEPIYERIVIGYWVMRGVFDSTLEMKLDKELKGMIKQEFDWRYEIKKGSEYSQILGYVRARKNMEIGKAELLDHMYNLGYDEERAQGIIKKLISFKGLRETDAGMLRIPRKKKKGKKNSN